MSSFLEYLKVQKLKEDVLQLKDKLIELIQTNKMKIFLGLFLLLAIFLIEITFIFSEHETNSITPFGYYNKQFWEGILVEAHGVMIEFIVIILLYEIYKKSKENEKNKRYVNKAYANFLNSTLISLDHIIFLDDDKNSSLCSYSFGESSFAWRCKDDYKNSIIKNRDIPTHTESIKKSCQFFIETYERNENIIQLSQDLKFMEDVKETYHQSKRILEEINNGTEYNNVNLTISAYIISLFKIFNYLLEIKELKITKLI